MLQVLDEEVQRVTFTKSKILTTQRCILAVDTITCILLKLYLTRLIRYKCIISFVIRSNTIMACVQCNETLKIITFLQDCKVRNVTI